MFIIKYHIKGKPSKYFGRKRGADGLVADKQLAYLFGENTRTKAENIVAENPIMSLVTVPVSELAEEIYRDGAVQYKKLRW